MTKASKKEAVLANKLALVAGRENQFLAVRGQLSSIARDIGKHGYLTERKALLAQTHDVDWRATRAFMAHELGIGLADAEFKGLDGINRALVVTTTKAQGVIDLYDRLQAAGIDPDELGKEAKAAKAAKKLLMIAKDWQDWAQTQLTLRAERMALQAATAPVAEPTKPAPKKAVTT